MKIFIAILLIYGLKLDYALYWYIAAVLIGIWDNWLQSGMESEANELLRESKSCLNNIESNLDDAKDRIINMLCEISGAVKAINKPDIYDPDDDY